MPVRRRHLLVGLAGLVTLGMLWGVPQLPATVSPTGSSSQVPLAARAAPPPRHVTRSLSELGDLGVWGPQMNTLSDHALLLNGIPQSGAELLAVLLQRLQHINGFRLSRLRLHGGLCRLSAPQQEDLVAEVTDVLRSEAVPVAFYRSVHFTNFSSFDRQSPTYINLVRDPLQKASSKYMYQSGKSTDGTLQSGSGCQYLSRESMHLTIPFFCGHPTQCMDIDDEWALQRAKSNIERYFPVVGVLEEINVTLAVLEARLPLFFQGALDLYSRKFSDPQLQKQQQKNKWKNGRQKKLAKQIDKEYDLYNWLKQRLLKQFTEEIGKTPLPDEAGQDRIAYSIHSRARLLKQ